MNIEAAALELLHSVANGLVLLTVVGGSALAALLLARGRAG